VVAKSHPTTLRQTPSQRDDLPLLYHAHPASAMVRDHEVLGVFPHLKSDFGGMVPSNENLTGGIMDEVTMSVSARYEYLRAVQGT